LRRPAGLLAGSLAGGAVFALGLGLILLPMTLIGMIILVGVLGLIPFGTAWVFGRNARAAWRAATRHRAAPVCAAVGFIFACGLPCVLQVMAWSAFRSAMELATSADPGEAEQGVEQLSRLRFVVNADDLVWEFAREHDPDRR